MAINVSQPYSPTNNGQPVINPQELAEQYGWAYSFLNSIPELKALFQQAVANQWDPTKFQAELTASKWYQDNSESVRNALTQKAVDPSTYAQQVLAEKAIILEQATALGAGISDALASTIATQQVTYGWDEAQVNQALAQYVKLNASGSFGGVAGQNAMSINQLAYNNGVALSPSSLQNMLQKVTANKSSLEDIQGFVRQMAASKYPALAAQIANGVNVSDIAAPFTNSMQNILEVGPGQANLNNPLIQRALNGQDAAGQPNGMNLADFNNYLRAQPEWRQTQNAQNSTMGTAQQILQTMGFTS